MNDLKVFENVQFGKIRTVLQDGEPWFVALDVCDVFSESNRNRAMQSLSDDEKGYTQMTTPGGLQNMATVSESGLYALLFAMQPLKARGMSDEYVESKIKLLHDFRRWVTHDVLPSIRKHGAYMTPDALEAAIANPDMMIGLLQNLKAHQAEIAAQQNYISTLEPKAEFYDAVAGSKTAIDIGNAAKVLGIPGIGRNKLFEILRGQGILDNSNIPYQAYIDRGYFRVIEQKYTTPNGEIRISFKTLVYQRGLDYIRKIVTKEKSA